jgi:hypothetical protein
MVALCKPCHEMFHWGFAGVRGRGEEALDRLAAVNCWSSAELLAYRDGAGASWERRNRFGWALDLSVYRGARLIVSTRWQIAEENDVRVLRNGDAATVILGVGYVVGMGEHPPEPLEDAYDGLGQERGDFSFAGWVRGAAG